MSYDNLLIYVVFKTGLYIMEDILGGIQALDPLQIIDNLNIYYD